MEAKSPHQPAHRRSQSGMTLIEVVIALTILLIVAAGIMTVAVVGTTTTENQGHLAARAAEYAQDKMEQLIGLAFCDGGDGTAATGTDTTQFPAASTGGTGLAPGGSFDTTAPVTTPGTGFVDYLDVNGNPLAPGVGGAAPDGWYYIRVWQILTPNCTPPASYCTPPPPASCTVKQITVTAGVRYNIGSNGTGATAQATLTTLKTYPF
jgi:prepilin-type N-terminal cleavage/methylation domain-containing protein